MLADDMPCNARNPFPGGIYNSKDHGLNLYEGDVEVDYRYYDGNVVSSVQSTAKRRGANETGEMCRSSFEDGAK